jgi:hypothetical protein
MKRKLFLALGGAFATAALVLSVFTTSASSLQDLRAKANPGAGSYCATSAGSDCRSHATGNIYPDHKVTPYDAVAPAQN